MLATLLCACPPTVPRTHPPCAPPVPSPPLAPPVRSRARPPLPRGVLPGGGTRGEPDGPIYRLSCTSRAGVAGGGGGGGGPPRGAACSFFSSRCSARCRARLDMKFRDVARGVNGQLLISGYTRKQNRTYFSLAVFYGALSLIDGHVPGLCPHDPWTASWR